MSREQTISIGSLSEQSQGAGLPVKRSIPWRSGLQLGDGINSADGRVMAKAVELSTLTAGALNMYETSIGKLNLCPTTESVIHALCPSDADTSLLVTRESIDTLVGRAGRLVKDIKYSQTSFTVVIRWNITVSPAEPQFSDLKLTYAAATEIATEPSRFSLRHGDYFVAGIEYTSELDMVLVFSYPSEDGCAAALKSLDFVSNDSSDETGKDVDVDGLLAAFEGATVELRVQMVGINPESPDQEPAQHFETIQDLTRVHERLAWIQKKENRSAIPVSANLLPYSVVDSRATPAEEVTDLEKIHRLLLSSAISFEALQFRNEPVWSTFRQIADAFHYEGEKISKNTSSLLSMLEDVQTLLDHDIKIYNLWMNLAGLAYHEASTGSVHVGMKPNNMDWISVEKIRPRIVVLGTTSSSTAQPVQQTQNIENFTQPATRVVGWTVGAPSSDAEWSITQDAVLAAARDVIFTIHDSKYVLADWDIVLYVVCDPYLDALVRTRDA